jgi:hypothetical protein
VERNRAVTLRIEVGSTAGSCTLPSDLSLVVKAQEAQKVRWIDKQRMGGRLERVCLQVHV